MEGQIYESTYPVEFSGAQTTAGRPRFVDDRYAEVPGSLERLANQIASVEIAAQELASRLNPIMRMEAPEPARDPGGVSSLQSGVNIADAITTCADRVQQLDAFLRNIEGRVAL